MQPPSPFPAGHTNRLALFWLTTAVGAVCSMALQLFFYVNEFVRAHGNAPAVTFAPDLLWLFPLFYAAWIVTVLLALRGTRLAQRAVLVLGSLLVVLSTLGGVADGMRDSANVTISALLLITLPGVFAIGVTWRHITFKGNNHVHE